MTSHEPTTHAPKPDEDRVIRIPFSAIVFLLVILILGFVAFRSVRQNAVNTYASAPSPATDTPASDAPAPANTQSADGVDITVEHVERRGAETAVTVAMNNHRYDLSDPAIASRSFLDGMPAAQFNILETSSGGHHARAIFVFSSTGTRLLIGVTEDVVVEFEAI